MVRTKLKNLVSGTTVEDTFRMSETFQTAQVDTNDAVYSYDDDRRPRSVVRALSSCS